MRLRLLRERVFRASPGVPRTMKATSSRAKIRSRAARIVINFAISPIRVASTVARGAFYTSPPFPKYTSYARYVLYEFQKYTSTRFRARSRTHTRIYIRAYLAVGENLIRVTSLRRMRI